MAKRLDGKVAIVTGASKGIGAEIALQLAKEGAAVVVNYSTSKEGADRIVNEIVRNGGKAVAVQAHVGQQADVKRLFEEACKAFKKVDILVNNAGIYEVGPLENITADHFHKLFDVNVLSILYASQEAAKYFSAEGGSIINISSIVGKSPEPTLIVYSATKAAVDSITKALSKELGKRKIRVNTVNPGMVNTEGVRTAGFANSDFQRDVEAKTPLGRIGQPQDIAPAVAFLASDDAAWITGESLVISGGYYP